MLGRSAAPLPLSRSVWSGRPPPAANPGLRYPARLLIWAAADDPSLHQVWRCPCVVAEVAGAGDRAAAGVTVGGRRCGRRRRCCCCDGVVRCELGLIERFHNDADRRDFISMGAAVGFAAAFGAPVGGVLFALEEVASFYDAKLVWRTLSATTVACFVIALCERYISPAFFETHSSPCAFNSSVTASSNNERTFAPGLLTFTSAASFERPWENVFCILIGVAGGLGGALFNRLHRSISRLRQRCYAAAAAGVPDPPPPAAGSAPRGKLERSGETASSVARRRQRQQRQQCLSRLYKLADLVGLALITSGSLFGEHDLNHVHRLLRKDGC